MQLKIYRVSVVMVSEVSRVARQVARHDRDLARQMRRAASSVPLNIAEGEYGQGGNAVARYATALGSTKEIVATLDVAVAAEYLEEATTTSLRDRLDHIVAVLWKLTHRR